MKRFQFKVIRKGLHFVSTTFQTTSDGYLFRYCPYNFEAYPKSPTLIISFICADIRHALYYNPESHQLVVKRMSDSELVAYETI
jgi:hypothetical protein